MKHTYQLQTFIFDKWVKLFEAGKERCLGYLSAKSELSPRNAFRVGQVAGFPTDEQYRQAA